MYMTTYLMFDEKHLSHQLKTGILRFSIWEILKNTVGHIRIGILNYILS